MCGELRRCRLKAKGCWHIEELQWLCALRIKKSLIVAVHSGSKVGPRVIKKIRVTLNQQKSSVPANTVTDKGSYTPWVAPYLNSNYRLGVLMFLGKDSC